MQRFRENKRKLSVVDVCLAAYFCVLFGNQLDNSFDNTLRHVTFFTFLAAAFLLEILPMLFRGEESRFISTFTIWLISFWSYAYLSYFWAENPAYLLQKRSYFNYAIQVLAITPIVTARIRSIDDVLFLMHVMLFANVYSAILLLLNTSSDLIGSERIGMAIGVDRNLVGMRLGFAFMFACYFYEEHRKLRYIIVALLAAGVLMLTGSRKAVVIIGLGMALYLILNAEGANVIRNAVVLVVVVSFAYLMVKNVPVLYNVMGRRVESLVEYLIGEGTSTDFSANERTWFRNYAMSMWRMRPTLGWGFVGFEAEMWRIGYRIVGYSHCNYTELLATLGTVGFVFYYWFYAYLLIWLQRLGVRRNGLVTLSFTLLITLLVIEYGWVSFVRPDVFFYLMIIFGTLKVYKGAITHVEDSRSASHRRTTPHYVTGLTVD